ncbi:DUF4012 domain-containing protein [Arthrobacter sp. Alg241-R88]|uniref:DUF4012 domain-containing protein n=1 Tax=Arthrobacter sp. Alg241-R88 TaxID=2305984 RepID=UPI001F07FC72|nr:DUF4012 domain-containing protein [Arthrobacter sp. Alg241-R88]
MKRIVIISAGIFLIVAGCILWLSYKASSMYSHLNSATSLVSLLKDEILQDDTIRANEITKELQTHTSAARGAGEDPLWKAAGMLPWAGANFRAASEVAVSADDVTQLGLTPLVDALGLLDLKMLTPSSEGVDLSPLSAARPKLLAAAHAVRESSDRLNAINESALIPQLAVPLVEAREELSSMRNGLDTAADISSIAPNMLGAEAPRRYLLLIQNNAESRASGGIPGAVAVLSVDQGKLTLESQTSASALGKFSPAIAVEAQQQLIYSRRPGLYMQDVNLTPDFPTTADLAKRMWETRMGGSLDGVVSIDPVALSYILDATGVVHLSDPLLLTLAGERLPTELNSGNLVRTLLSDVYAEISEPQLQDAYFAGVAHEVFDALSKGTSDPKGLIVSLTRSVDEGRLRVWSNTTEEQDVLASYALGGSITGVSVSPAEFGVYFNDGTGAKMDYYVKRTVQLLKECAKDGYEETTVRVTSVNSAPADAATSLPTYVTGGGTYGVPPGSVQTNIVAYGPVQANVETAKLDGEKTQFAPYVHSNRPVGVVAVQLAPGESRTVEFTFGKIVQHVEPNLVVTPTVEPVMNVRLPTQSAACS